MPLFVFRIPDFFKLLVYLISNDSNTLETDSTIFIF